MTTAAAWKHLERKVCRLLGGDRRGPTGIGQSDCVDVPFAVEIKRSKRGVPEGRWILQARAHGAREGMPWLLVVGHHHDRNPIVVMDLYTFAEIAQDAGRIPELELP